MKEVASGVNRGDSTGAVEAIIHGDQFDVKEKTESEDSKMIKVLSLREYNSRIMETESITIE